MTSDMLEKEASETSQHIQDIAKFKWNYTLPRSSDAYRLVYEEMARRHGIFRMKVFDPAGTIIWSDDSKIIGKKFPGNIHLEQALKGKVVVAMGDRKEEHESEVSHSPENRLLEVYTPFYTQGGKQISGVIETYKVPHSLFHSMDLHRRLVWAGAFLGAFLIIVSLIWLFKGALSREANLRDHLEEMRKFNEEIVHNLTTGVVVLDRDFKVLSWNPQMERLCDQSPMGRDVIGKPLEEVLCSEGLKTLVPELQKAFSSGQSKKLQSEGWCFCPGKDSRTLNLSIVPVSNGRQGVEKAVVAVDDLTQMVNLQKQLIQSEKLASLGEISAGLAHEINNPLGIIVSKIKILLSHGRTNGYPEEVIRDLDLLDRHASRISTIMRNLLTFTRRPSFEHTRLNLNSVIQEALALVENPYGKQGIRIESDLTENLPLISGDANQLQQVFLNILSNAKDAMPDGGAIRISSYRTSGGFAGIKIADEGMGIPQENLERIFDPFFTTKAEGKGTGLGLSLTTSIVKAHGGKIRVDSEFGKGAAFEFLFPPMPVMSNGGS